jgi:hypothetical protein
VDIEGPHPSLTAVMSPKSCKNSFGRTETTNFGNQIAAVLECCHSEGTNLASLKPEARVIPLGMSQSLEVGRNSRRICSPIFLAIRSRRFGRWCRDVIAV